MVTYMYLKCRCNSRNGLNVLNIGDNQILNLGGPWNKFNQKIIKFNKKVLSHTEI